MTTIAYKDGVVAADTGLTNRGSRVGHTVKIVCGDGEVAGSCGDTSWGHAFRDWFMRGECGPAPQITKDAGGDDAHGVIFRRDGRIQVFESPGSHWITAPFFAIGSGAAEARGAMQAGATAEQAVRVAMELDNGTYGDVTVLRVGVS